MKKFIDMTEGEIDAMSDEDFKAVSPFDKKTCYDCGHLKMAINWWCTNEEAKKSRGTTLPGCIKCSYWKPDWKVIDDKYKTEENGYIKPIGKLKQIGVISTRKYFKHYKLIIIAAIIAISVLLWIIH